MLFVGITLTGWVTLFMGLSLSILAGAMFMLGTKRVHYLWGAFTAAGALWGAGFFMVSGAGSFEEAQFWWRIAFVGIICAPFTFFHFILEFINLDLKKRTKQLLLGALYSLCGLFIVLNLSTNLLINDLTFLFDEVYFDTPAALLHPYFTIFYVGLVNVSYILIFRELFLNRLTDIQRKQAWYLILGSGIGFIGGSMDFLLVYNVVQVHPIRNLTVVLGAAIVGFSILRYKLFDVKVVAAQFLTLFIVAFSVIRLATSAGLQERVFNLLMLGIAVAIGVYLVRSVKLEVEQREEIQNLYKELEVKNQKLTELDKLKSQFLSIATHELRTPLTIVRNYISLLLDGTYGKVPPAAEEGAHQVFERVTDMTHSVDTYLNVSRIEQGKISYTFAPDDITRLVRLAVDGLQANADKKGITLSLTIKPGAESITANIDASKITEVIINLIDNSIKYTPKGSVAVTLEKVGQQARMTIQDTGVGMSEKTQKGLFKLFSPGEDSKKINPASTGVGLYVSKAHVDAHKGSLTAFSEGTGKGSTFVLQLPL